jgi:hypothetical protein
LNSRANSWSKLRNEDVVIADWKTMYDKLRTQYDDARFDSLIKKITKGNKAIANVSEDRRH